MSKTISALIAAVAALTLSGGAYAQAAGGSAGGAGGSGSGGSTASPANLNGPTTGGYGTPGVTNSQSGMGVRAPNSGLPSTDSSATPAPKTNNTLATPSVASPAAGQ